MNDVEKPAESILARYAAAVFAKDVDGLLALYSVDVRIFDTWNAWCYEGAAAWRSIVEEWFGSLGDETVRVSFEDVRTYDRGALAVVCAVVRYAALSASGEELRWLQNRVTFVLDRTDQGWAILHEHASSPANFKSKQVSLQRDSF
jgi:ketosteroid isomerase-like protein